MADANKIKATILKLAGNPETGVIANLAGDWAEAIVRLDHPVNDDTASVTIEKRVTRPDETR